jgi:8-oxo-dGTP diphosphatase
VAAVIERDGNYLITQRRPVAVLPALWEFPGGKVEDGETDAAAAEARGACTASGSRSKRQLISFVSHPYEHYTVDLYLYECHHRWRASSPARSTPSSGCSSDEFDQYPFTPADEAR